MPLSHSELLDLVDEVNVAVAQAVANYAELNEGMIDDAATDAAKAKVERLKAKADAAKQRLTDLRDRQRHKREMERRRKENERQRESQQTEGRRTGMVTLRDAAGRAVGFMRQMGPNRTDYFDKTGKLVSREVGEMTYNASGRAAFRGKLGLAVLGRLLR